jgi:hypothetical protein
MTPAPRQLKRTAYHEAGHAVAAVLMDVPFRRVTILPDAQCAGRVDLANVEPPIHVKAARDHWARRICVFLAGPLAETLHTRCWQQQPISDEDTDEFKVWEITVCFGPPAKADRWVNRLRFSTLEKLRAPDVWAVVEVVALELVKRKTLTGAKVHELVKRKGTPERGPCGQRSTSLAGMRRTAAGRKRKGA